MKIVETTRQLTFAIEALTVSLIHTNPDESSQQYMAQMKETLLPLKDQWEIIANEILAPKTVLPLDTLNAFHDAVSRLIVDIRHAQKEDQSLPSLETLKDFTTLTISIERIISLLSTLCNINNKIIANQVAAPEAMR